jgi:chromosome segregation ATPase
MDTNAKTLFEESIKGLQGSFHSLWTEGEDLSKKLSAINERVNELSATTLEANQEVTSVNKLSAFKEYDRQIVELTKQVDHLEKENNKLKEDKKKESEEENAYNSGGEQPPPDMPVADKEESGDEEEESGDEDDEEEGEEYVYKGETYWMMDEKLYKFVSETEIEEEPCGVIVNKKPKLF